VLLARTLPAPASSEPLSRSIGAAQLDAFTTFVALQESSCRSTQHAAADFVGRLSPAATTNDAGGEMPCWRAHASRSAGVWQQQSCQHCSALRQPHGLLMHGKIADVSFKTIGTGSAIPSATKR
jgi:hypothetical protein